MRLSLMPRWGIPRAQASGRASPGSLTAVGDTPPIPQASARSSTARGTWPLNSRRPGRGSPEARRSELAHGHRRRRAGAGSKSGEPALESSPSPGGGVTRAVTWSHPEARRRARRSGGEGRLAGTWSERRPPGPSAGCGAPSEAPRAALPEVGAGPTLAAPAPPLWPGPSASPKFLQPRSWEGTPSRAFFPG